MPLPANVTTVTVLGTFLTPEGDPSTGTVSFTPSSWLLNSGANIAIPNSSVVKTLGTAGDFTAVLPITDDPDLSPGGWVYSVSEVVDGVSQSYNIAIPGTVAAGGTVFLADLAPVAPAGPEYYSLASSLAIGTVSTVPTGGSATASITGLAPSQVLNLGIPTGATGTVASAGSGSVGTAAVAPQGDPDTGIYFPAANQVAITTGGTERVRVGSTGLVGIGTTAPTHQLHVSRDAGITVLLRTAAANGGLLIDRSNTTVAAPSIVAGGDAIGNVSFRGYDGGAFRTAAQIVCVVNGTPGSSSMPGVLSFQTTPDGSITVTERMRIDNAGLITGTGTSLGAWTAYTPTLGGTGWDIGNGTFVGAYCQIGKVVHFRVSFTAGSTTTFGASAAPTITLPVTAISGTNGAFALTGRFRDASAGSSYLTLPILSTTTVYLMQHLGASGIETNTTATAPFTWAVSDQIFLHGTYQAA